MELRKAHGREGVKSVVQVREKEKNEKMSQM
jgi:hypothetical protein